MKKLLLTLFAAAMMLLCGQNAYAIVYTALSGSNWNAGEGPAKLFDGTTDTKWGTHDDEPYVVFKTSVPIKPTAYELVIANDTHSNTGRNWKSWKIYAGNFASEADATRNASGWVEIDSKVNQSLPTAQFATQSFSLPETVGDFYSYFRIEIKALSGSWNDYCQMDGFSFTSPALPVGTVDFTCTATQGNNGNAAEGMDKLFDGVYTTKYCGNVTYTDASTSEVHPAYAIVEASSAVYCWGYEMTTANDNEQYGRCVTGWTLYGSNDASAATNASHSSWVAISNLGTNSLVQRKNNYTQRFFCDKDKVDTAYKYFKVTLDDGGFVQLTQFKLCYETCPVVSYNWESGHYDSTTERNGDTETKKAVDGLLNQKMEGNDLSGSWVIIKTANDNAYTVKSYSFSTHDDGNGGCNNRAPKTWIIEGSNDKSSWTTIDEVTSGDPIDNLNYKTFEFKPSNVDNAFKYIKLTLNSMKGTGWTQVGEFHVTNGCASHNWVDLDYVAPTCVSEGGGEKQCSVCGITKLTGVEPATGNHTYDANGFCTVCNQPNPNFMTKNGDFYEPTTVVQFNWLKAMIQSGATVNIRLTQDVDLSGFAGFGNGEEVNDHLVPFSGEFDGGGHWIKNLHIDVVKKNTGLFGLTNGANFHDLGFFKAYVKVNGTQNVGIIVGNANNTTFNRVAIMYGSYVEGYDHVGAFAGNTQGNTTISNCISDAEVYSTTYQAGGFVGTSSGLTLEKSLFRGSVRCGNGAGDVGGFISRIERDNATTIKNNIMAATMLTTAKTEITTPLVAQHTNSTYENNYVAASTIFKSTDSNAADDLKAGKTMEFDNLDGYQGKTTDDADMKVASFYTSSMDWDMTNDWKFYKDGRYPVLQWMDGMINISNASELAAFASKVNSGMTDLVAQLTADIDYTAYTGVANMIGDNNNTRYAGIFDGQGHTVTVAFNTTSVQETGLFRRINGATIQNLKVAGTITASDKFAGGIVARVNGGTGTIRNCESAVTINDSESGDATHGGILGVGSGTVQVTNCLFSGRINASSRTGCSGIVGWGEANVAVTNCLVIGEITLASGDNDIISRGSSTGSGNYYCGSYSLNNRLTATSATATQKTSGELCYMLNGNTNDGTTWTQTIGTDANPIPFSTSQKVHQASPSGYTNLTVVDGKTQIADGATLKKFATEVNAGNTNVDAVLTADINMNEIAWPKPIGDWHTNGVSSAYAGHFDGRGHTISNLTYTTTQNYHGLFGVISNATVENFTVSGSVTNASYSEFGAIGFARDTNPTIRNVHSYLNFENTNKGARIGGILGRPLDGCTVDIERCTYSGTLRSNDNEGNGNYGGMVGFVTTSGNTYTNITNCLFDGTLTNTADSPGNCTFGGIVGYIGGGPHITITNCLSVGTVASTKAGKICGAIKSGNSSVNNCYYNNDGTAANSIVENSPTVTATSKEAAQLASGEVCVALGEAWYQTLDTDDYPTLDSSSKQVLYVGAAGFTTFYDADNDWELNGDAQAYIGTFTPSGSALHLDEIDDIPAGTAVVIGGTYYNRVGTTATATTTGNVLLGSDGTITGDGESYYALSTLGGSAPIGFYPVGNGITIPAGKAYLYDGAGVKGFTFEFADDADGIKTLSNSPSKGENIFNVAGQKLSKMQKGINIVNGKKIMK